MPFSITRAKLLKNSCTKIIHVQVGLRPLHCPCCWQLIWPHDDWKPVLQVYVTTVPTVNGPNPLSRSALTT